jgi:hypothetical protein
LRAVDIDERLGLLWRINWVSMFQGTLLPSSQGFDLLRIYHLERRHADRRGVAGSTVFIERMMGVVLLCALSLVALPFVIGGAELWPLFLTVMSISATIGMAVWVILSRRLHGLYTGRKFANQKIARVFKLVDLFHGAIVNFPFGKVFPQSLAWIAGLQLAVVFTVYLVFRAYGSDVPLVVHLAIFPMISLLSIVPITIGGFGVREGFFVFFYSLVGVSPTVAVGTSIIQHLLLYYVPALVGGVMYLWDSLRGAEYRWPA